MQPAYNQIAVVFRQQIAVPAGGAEGFAGQNGIVRIRDFPAFQILHHVGFPRPFQRDAAEEARPPRLIRPYPRTQGQRRRGQYHAQQNHYRAGDAGISQIFHERPPVAFSDDSLFLLLIITNIARICNGIRGISENFPVAADFLCNPALTVLYCRGKQEIHGG